MIAVCLHKSPIQNHASDIQTHSIHLEALLSACFHPFLLFHTQVNFFFLFLATL